VAPPPKGEKTHLGHICTITQNFRPIGATVAEISVGLTKKMDIEPANLVPCHTNVWRVSLYQKIISKCCQLLKLCHVVVRFFETRYSWQYIYTSTTTDIHTASIQSDQRSFWRQVPWSLALRGTRCTHRTWHQASSAYEGPCDSRQWSTW